MMLLCLKRRIFIVFYAYRYENKLLIKVIFFKSLIISVMINILTNLKVFFADPYLLLSNIYIFVFGALIGSFLNVCIYRLPIGRSIVIPSSACTSCGQPVKWFMNIPVISYFILRGRCDTCFSSFSIRYAAIEFLNAVIYLLLFWKLGFGLEFIGWAIFSSCLIIIFFVDYDHWLILDSITFPMTIFGMVFHTFAGKFSFYDSFLFLLLPTFEKTENQFVLNFLDSLSGMLLGYLFFALIAFWGAVFFKQEAMGGGDIKFAVLIGAFLGCDKAFTAFLLSFFIGFVFVIPLLLKHKNFSKKPVPFGTFMAIAAFIVIFFELNFFSLYSYP